MVDAGSTANSTSFARPRQNFFCGPSFGSVLIGDGLPQVFHLCSKPHHHSGLLVLVCMCWCCPFTSTGSYISLQHVPMPGRQQHSRPIWYPSFHLGISCKEGEKDFSPYFAPVKKLIELTSTSLPTTPDVNMSRNFKILQGPHNSMERVSNNIHLLLCHPPSL